MFQKNVHIRQFKTYLERVGYNTNTCHMLPACVAEFLDKLEEKNINHLHEIEPVHINEHHEYLTQRPNRRKQGGLSSMMINHHMYAINVFLNYLEQMGTIRENPASMLSFPRPETKEREILTTEEINTLYEIVETYREKAILGIFYGCGLRRSEGVALDVKDISFKSSLLYVRQGKGKKKRVIPFNDHIREDFKNYLYNERWAQQGETAFITNIEGRRMKGNRYNQIVKELVQKAKIQKNISLHGLRHSIATHLLERGLEIEHVRDFLGHAYLEATQIYTRISKKRLLGL